MRLTLLLLACGLASADSAQDVLARAYEALRIRNYDTAIEGFLQAIQVSPERAAIHKDLAYTYLKIGENDLAREQFRKALEIDPSDGHTAMEYAYLCYEGGKQTQARRIFDRSATPATPMPQQAFQNVDAPLAAGIARWKEAIRHGRRQLQRAFRAGHVSPSSATNWNWPPEQYEKAWRLLPDRRSVLVDLGRVWQALDRTEDARAALLAASRGGEPRAAEMARELMPDRYPYVSEFRRAFAIGPLQRRTAPRVGLPASPHGTAGRGRNGNFAMLTDTVPDDLLSATQLGFLLYARGEREAAMPLFERVLAGKDDDLANRVRAVLRIASGAESARRRRRRLHRRQGHGRAQHQSRLYEGCAEVSARRHEADPARFRGHAEARLDLQHSAPGSAGLPLVRSGAQEPRPASRRGGRERLAQPARRQRRFPDHGLAVPDLLDSLARLLLLRADQDRDAHPVSRSMPYFSVRFVGDTRRTIGCVSRLHTFRRVRSFWRWAWPRRALARDHRMGRSRLRRRLYDGPHAARLPRRRLRWRAVWGTPCTPNRPAGSPTTTLDGVFVSRFGNDFLVYDQSRAGVYASVHGGCAAKLYWNGNLTFDTPGQYWANFGETGPGVRISPPVMPPSAVLHVWTCCGAPT